MAVCFRVRFLVEDLKPGGNNQVKILYGGRGRKNSRQVSNDSVPTKFSRRVANQRMGKQPFDTHFLLLPLSEVTQLSVSNFLLMFPDFASGFTTPMRIVTKD